MRCIMGREKIGKELSKRISLLTENLGQCRSRGGRRFFSLHNFFFFFFLVYNFRNALYDSYSS